MSLNGVELTSVPALTVGETVSVGVSAGVEGVSSAGAVSGGVASVESAEAVSLVSDEVSAGVAVVFSVVSSTPVGVVKESIDKSEESSPVGASVAAGESDELLKSGVSVTVGGSSVGEGSGVGSSDGGVSDGVSSVVASLSVEEDESEDEAGPGSSAGGNAGLTSSLLGSSELNDGVAERSALLLSSEVDELESVDELSSLELDEVTSIGSAGESTLGLDEITDLSS